MATITLTLNTKQTERAIDRLTAVAPIAIARALNKSIASAKVLMVRELGRDMGVKVSDLRDKIGLRQATPSHHVANLDASFQRIPLYDFSAKATRTGVTAKLGKTRAKHPHLFFATMSSGHLGVFGRHPTKMMRKVGPRGGRKQAIVERFGPSIAHVFLKYVGLGLARGQEQLVKNLKSEFRFALQQTP